MKAPGWGAFGTLAARGSRLAAPNRGCPADGRVRWIAAGPSSEPRAASREPRARRRRPWLLLGLTLVVIGARSGSAGPGPPPRDVRIPYQELNLSEPQEERLTALRTRINTEIRQLYQQMEDRRRELDDLYRRYDLDERRAGQLRFSIREVQGQVLELHHVFQVELRRILTPAQFDRLQQALRERRGPPRGRRRGPPFGPPHGPPPGGYSPIRSKPG